MIADPAEHDSVLDLIVSVDVPAAGVIAGVLDVRAPVRVYPDDAGREAALQQRRVTASHLAR